MGYRNVFFHEGSHDPSLYATKVMARYIVFRYLIRTKFTEKYKIKRNLTVQSKTSKPALHLRELRRNNQRRFLTWARWTITPSIILVEQIHVFRSNNNIRETSSFKICVCYVAPSFLRNRTQTLMLFHFACLILSWNCSLPNVCDISMHTPAITNEVLPGPDYWD